MSRLIYLSKHDFKAAKTCPTKLYYRKLNYPTNPEYNYATATASSTLIIHKMAKLLSDGIEIRDDWQSDRDWEKDIAKTQELLKQEQVVLFNAVIYVDHKLVVIDILRKNGNKFELIEVKPKSFDSRKEPPNMFWHKRSGKISSIWKSCLEDLTYQVYVLKEFLEQSLAPRFDGFTVTPYLCLPDRAKSTIDGLGAYFTITEGRVDFVGDLAKLRNQHILTFLDASCEVQELAPSVKASAQVYVNSLVGDRIHKLNYPLNKNCKTCEFKTEFKTESNPQEPTKNGFQECWGKLAQVQPHILDLYQVASIGEIHKPLVNVLIQAGQVSMYDLPITSLNDSIHKPRQLIQMAYTKTNQEWISEELAHVMAGFEYPLHFIDFETARLDVPFHKGLDLYEQIAFQWSCHRLNDPKAGLEIAPDHADWLDLGHDFPNFKFAEALMAQLGDRGTVMIWGSHEKSVLKDIYEQIEYYDYHHPQLKIWLEQLINSSDRLVDMHALTVKHYFHPQMKGKTSLKLVLPAIWRTNAYLHKIPWLASYWQQAPDGQIRSPYDVLPMVEILDKAEIIKEGNGAAIAYQELLYDTAKQEPEIQAKWRELLRQYCCLDTMAMIIVWTHWRSLDKITQQSEEKV